MVSCYVRVLFFTACVVAQDSFRLGRATSSTLRASPSTTRLRSSGSTRTPTSPLHRTRRCSCWAVFWSSSPRPYPAVASLERRSAGLFLIYVFNIFWICVKKSQTAVISVAPSGLPTNCPLFTAVCWFVKKGICLKMWKTKLILKLLIKNFFFKWTDQQIKP